MGEISEGRLRGKKEGWKCGKRQKVEREVGEGHVERTE